MGQSLTDSILLDYGFAPDATNDTVDQCFPVCREGVHTLAIGKRLTSSDGPTTERWRSW